MDDENKAYLETLKVLIARSRSTRIITITFIYVLLLTAMLVLTGIFALKSKNNNPITNFISSIVDNSNEIHQAVNILDQYSKMRDSLKNTINEDKKHESNLNNDATLKYRLQPGDFVLFKKDKSEKIADSIASILISLSVLLFIGYVTRILVIFAKYYMQLGHDYENQRIAYMLSKGDLSKFSTTLESLRDHHVSFDKTPPPPQEKIIAGLVEALSEAKSKLKKEN
ncbi:TPA: hypothetical protein OTQ49_003002 [Raoultella ornithinolytica]|nr:hypothetical protein [Raoultella ornithinolytica]